MDIPSASKIETNPSGYFENDRNLRILSRRNEMTGIPDPDFDRAFERMDEYMKLAFEAAFEALNTEEVPVGCVFVYNDEVIASGRNRVNE